MAKKNLLKANMKRPSLKREMKVTEETMNEVVQRVADNPPPPAKNTTTKQASKATSTAPTTSPAPAAAPKRGRGRPKKETTTATKSTRSVHPKEGTKRLTLDIPQSLHKQLKLLAIHQEISMKDYIIQVVERSLR